MDTNLTAALVTLLLQKQAAPVSGNSVLIVTIILAAIAPTLLAFASFLKSASAKMDAVETKSVVEKAAGSVEMIKSAVNGERAIMLSELKTLKDEILKVSTEKAVLMEQHRQESIQAKIATASAVAAPKLA